MSGREPMSGRIPARDLLDRRDRLAVLHREARRRCRSCASVTGFGRRVVERDRPAQRFGEHLEPEILRADVVAEADDSRAERASVLEEALDLVGEQPELEREVDVRARIREGEPGEHVDVEPRELADLRVGVRDEGPHAATDRVLDVARLLVRVGVDHPLGRDARGEHEVDLGVRRHIESGALGREHLDDGRMGERLHRVVVPHSRKGGVEPPECVPHGGTIEHEERGVAGGDGRGDLRLARSSAVVTIRGYSVRPPGLEPGTTD